MAVQKLNLNVDSSDVSLVQHDSKLYGMISFQSRCMACASMLHNQNFYVFKFSRLWLPEQLSVQKIPTMFSKMDSDGSGAVGEDEFVDCMAELFLQVESRLFL